MIQNKGKFLPEQVTHFAVSVIGIHGGWNHFKHELHWMKDLERKKERKGYFNL